MLPGRTLAARFVGENEIEIVCEKSGSKGLQVYAPLNTAISFDQTKELSHAFAQHLEGEHPNLVTSNMSKAVRKGKVFVDWSQNDEHKPPSASIRCARKKNRPSRHR